MNKLITTTLFLLALSVSGDDKESFYKEVFLKLASTKEAKIEDPISKEAINTKLLIAKDLAGKKLGYIREVTTTTGCNSACLPVIFTLFYSTKYELIKLKSKPGLTKKFHSPMTEQDLNRLHLILALNPTILKNIKDPKTMTDALSGATKSEYVESVVKDAAYSTLRINLYNQQTIRELKKGAY